MGKTNNIQNTQKMIRYHYIRTVFASFFGFLAVVLIIISIVVVWLNRTLTNTNQYVSTVAPLVTKPDVQNFVVDKTTTAILENKGAPIRDIAQQLLPQDQIVGKTDDQLHALLTPVIKENVRSVIASPDFARLWSDTNKNIQEQIVTQLSSKSATMNLNFHPVIVGVIDELGQTKLNFVQDKLDIKPDVGNVQIKGDQLNTARKVYNYFQDATLAIVGLAVLAAILCVLISVHHLKTIRRITLATGIFTGILALALAAPSLINMGGMDVEQRKMVVTVFDSLTHQLRMSLMFISVVCLAVVIGSKVYAAVMTRRPQLKKA